VSSHESAIVLTAAKQVTKLEELDAITNAFVLQNE